MGGATGLDYAAVAAYLTECDLTGPERKDTFECIRAAESATLSAWAEKAKKKEPRRHPQWLT